jgi:hypothetical protein
MNIIPRPFQKKDSLRMIDYLLHEHHPSTLPEEGLAQDDRLPTS